MMLFKLSLGNICKSLRDYAIYFFTLVIGVSVFYVFNAIGGQSAMMAVTESRMDVVELLTTMLSGVSVFVACVLGLLIVYASRFLMKRRNKEFALYMTLGMSKGSISIILLLETIFIGIFSLAVGLIVGIGLSQLMSAVVANLFEADLTAYRFIVSGDSVFKTVLYFVVMYLVVIIFNSAAISRMKLIDLIQADRRSEHVKLKNPLICMFIFVIAVVMLGYAYYQVGWHFSDLDGRKLTLYIAMGSAATFLFFWSVSSMLLRIAMVKKNMYYRGLNAFTFRQISSKVNTMVFSMTVICLMLFVTICTLSAAFSVRNSMNANLNRLCPADFEIEYREFADEEGQELSHGDVMDFLGGYDYDLTRDLSDYVHIRSYVDPEFTIAAFLGDQLDDVMEQYRFLVYDVPFQIYSISDYNALMRLYGREQFELKEDEFLLICNYKSARNIMDAILEKGYKTEIMGHELYSRFDDCQDGFVDISVQAMNAGLFVVPDSIADDSYAGSDYLIGNYAAATKEERMEIERRIRGIDEKVFDAMQMDGDNRAERHCGYRIDTKVDISEATIGLGAIATFLGLYIGLIFLISSGVVLALKDLSESVDSIGRYEMLRKIGAEESEIGRSLFRQTGLFFLFPMLLACVHSVFGMKFAVNFLEIFGTEKMWESIIVTAVIILLIYGGYFLITFHSSKQIIKVRNL